MAEALGIAASVISLVQIAKTCIDAYEIVSDAKHATEDLNQLVDLLFLERVPFLQWCHYIGLLDVVRLSETHGRVPDTQEILKFTPCLQSAYAVNGIVNTLQSIHNVFTASQALLSNYMISYTPATRAPLVSSLVRMSTLAISTTALGDYLWSDDKARQNHRKTQRSSMSVLGRGKWVAKDKKKFKGFVDQLRLFNDGLDSVFTRTERIQLQRQTELLVTTTPVGKFVSNSDVGNLLEETQEPPDRLIASSTEDQAILPFREAPRDGNARLRQLLALQQRCIDINEDHDTSTREANGQVSVRMGSLSAGVPDLRQLATDVTFPIGESSLLQRRSHAYYKGTKPVIVEWKHCSHRIPADLLRLLKRRVSLLTVQLQQTSRTAGFSILNCLGYFEDVGHHRMGIIFEYPQNDRPLEPVSLQERITRDRSQKAVRDLSSRFAVARALALTFYRLHSVSWVHKSFRSDNVLLFEGPENNDESALGTPYVCGFDFARQDSPTELTENVPTILLSQESSLEHSLYKHPDLDLRQPDVPVADDTMETVIAKSKAAEAVSKAFRYRKAYDIYSLGVVLLEVGLWVTVKGMRKRNESLEKFRERLHADLVPELRYRMGPKYYNAVRKCLAGDFAGRHGRDVEEEEQADSTVTELKATRTWLATFESEVVNELEKCSV